MGIELHFPPIFVSILDMLLSWYFWSTFGIFWLQSEGRFFFSLFFLFFFFFFFLYWAMLFAGLPKIVFSRSVDGVAISSLCESKLNWALVG